MAADAAAAAVAAEEALEYEQSWSLLFLISSLVHALLGLQKLADVLLLFLGLPL